MCWKGGGGEKLPFGRKANEETSHFSTDIINTKMVTPFEDFCLSDRLHVQLVKCIISAEPRGAGERERAEPEPVTQPLHQVWPQNLTEVGKANRGAPSSFPTSHP